MVLSRADRQPSIFHRWMAATVYVVYAEQAEGSYKEVTSVPAPGTPPLANSAPGSEYRPGKGPKATVQVRIPLAAGPTPSRTVWRSRTRTAGDDRTVYLDGQRCNGKIKAASKSDFIFSLNAVLREHCKRGYLKSNVVANPTQIRCIGSKISKNAAFLTQEEGCIFEPFAELSPTLHDALYIAYNINQQRYIWDE